MFTCHVGMVRILNESKGLRLRNSQNHLPWPISRTPLRSTPTGYAACRAVLIIIIIIIMIIMIMIMVIIIIIIIMIITIMITSIIVIIMIIITIIMII